MKPNSWQSRFGAKRRAIDRALLRECENSMEEPIVIEKVARRVAAAKMGLANEGERLPDDLWKQAEDEARAAIARAFGRPVQ